MPTPIPALEGESLKIILISLLGWTCFSTGDVITKDLASNYNPSMVAVIGAIFSIPLLITWIFFQRGVDGFKTKKWRLFVMRAVVTGLTAFCMVNALSHMPLADLYGITFSAPFLTVILAVLLLNESVGWHRWLAIIIGFMGVLVVVGPQYEQLNTGILFAVCAVVVMALGTIIIRKIGNQEYIPLLILYAYIGVIVINLPLVWVDFAIPPMPDLWLFLANGLLILSGISLTTYSFSHAQSTASVAPFLYIQAIWGVVFGYFFFDDVPTIATIIGLTIVIGAGLYMMYRENQLRKI
jgi:drug/metabolite transporter (DMT)-like permease